MRPLPCFLGLDSFVWFVVESQKNVRRDVRVCMSLT